MQKTMSVKWKGSFDAAHRLPNYNGKCFYLHGHSWVVEVEIEASKGEDGMIMDFTKIKEIATAYDHDYLNHPERTKSLPAIEVPTAENISEMIADKIVSEIGLCEKVVVRVYESPTSCAQCVLIND